MSKPLYGLVLVGGRSTRMGSEKALLKYGEQTQLERTADLLSNVADKTFVSLRKDQDLSLPGTTEAIYDSIDRLDGPLCGILSAMQRHPNTDWLVVACDLPRLDIETLQELASAFNEDDTRLTAYKSTRDGSPEPLCAIYPAGAAPELLELARQMGTRSPRKLLIAKEARLLELKDPRSLENINTVEEYKAATQSS